MHQTNGQSDYQETDYWSNRLEFCTIQSPWSFTTWYLITWKYHTCTVMFWSLPALEHLQDPHHQRHIRCLSGVWSGTTLRRTLFDCQSHPMQLTVLRDNAAAVADFLNLDNW